MACLTDSPHESVSFIFFKITIYLHIIIICFRQSNWVLEQTQYVYYQMVALPESAESQKEVLKEENTAT